MTKKVNYEELYGYIAENSPIHVSDLNAKIKSYGILTTANISHALSNMLKKGTVKRHSKLKGYFLLGEVECKH